MWRIRDISEADFGCEERLPGEPLLVSVLLETDTGEQRRIEVADSWLISQELGEGDIWPEETEESPSLPGTEDAMQQKSNLQFAFMDNYMDALDEMNES